MDVVVKEAAPSATGCKDTAGEGKGVASGNSLLSSAAPPPDLLPEGAA